MWNKNKSSSNKKWSLYWINRAIFIFFSLIVAYLTLLSIFSTCYLGIFEFEDGEVNKEHTFWVSDNPILILFISALALIVISKIGKLCAAKSSIKVKTVILTLVFLLGLSFLISTGLEPRDDQMEVMNIAAQMREGDFSAFLRDGYLSVCPHQAGLVLYFYLLSFLFGANNYLGLQIINLFYLIGIYILISVLAGMIFQNKKDENNKLTENLSFFACIAFLPLFSYISFVYGTLPGLFFALLSIYFELKFFSCKNMRYAIGSVVCISLAIQLKSNYEIFFIAILIVAVLELISNIRAKEKAALPLLYCLFLVLGFMIGKMMIAFILFSITGHTLGQGIPFTAYIAMGLQEGKAGPGWWNFYTWAIYKENDYDYVRTSELITQDIQKAIRIFGRDLKYTGGFFIRKIASIWNNPTFEGFDILKWRISSHDSAVTDSIIYGSISRGITYYLNILHTLILLGAVYWMVGKRKKIDNKELIFPLVFIGGFIFHLFWEAKCQYTIPYFVLLLPYSVEGYRIAGLCMASHMQDFKANKSSHKKYYVGLSAAVLCVVIIVGLSKTEFFRNIISLNSNEEYYEEYLLEQKEEYY